MNFSAYLLLMCRCGWTMTDAGRGQRVCTNPYCPERGKFFLPLIELQGVAEPVVIQ